MANSKLVDVVRQGRLAVAKWRKENPKIVLDLTDAELPEADLRGCGLQRALLIGTNLQRANLMGASLSGADLTRADLRGAQLVKADFHAATLFKATLHQADLSGASLRKANLISAFLEGADLRKADLVEADLSHAQLTGATLLGTDFNRANVHGTDFSKALLGGASFGNTNLAQALNLETVAHIGPSTIGVDTLFQTGGNISDVFLRGCGVPETLITSLPALTQHPLGSASCFILFSPEESTFVYRLHDALQEKGVRCWLDERPHDQSQVRYQDLERGVRWHDKLVLVASKSSLSGWWIDDTLKRAFEVEERVKKEHGQVVQFLNMLNLDGFMFSGDWQHKHEKHVAARVVADFNGWRRNKTKFDDELQKLIKAFGS